MTDPSDGAIPPSERPAVPPPLVTPKESVVSDAPADQMPLTLEPEAQAAPTRRSGLLVVGIAVLALLLGAVIGYVAGMPQRNDLRDQRNAAQVTAQTAQDDLAAAKAQADKVAEARTTCQQAATDAQDLIGQWENYYLDQEAWWMTEEGSAAEAEMTSHMTEQMQKMDEQRTEVLAEVTDCKTAVG